MMLAFFVFVACCMYSEVSDIQEETNELTRIVKLSSAGAERNCQATKFDSSAFDIVYYNSYIQALPGVETTYSTANNLSSDTSFDWELSQLNQSLYKHFTPSRIAELDENTLLNSSYMLKFENDKFYASGDTSDLAASLVPKYSDSEKAFIPEITTPTELGLTYLCPSTLQFYLDTYFKELFTLNFGYDSSESLKKDINPADVSIEISKFSYNLKRLSIDPSMFSEIYGGKESAPNSSTVIYYNLEYKLSWKHTTHTPFFQLGSQLAGRISPDYLDTTSNQIKIPMPDIIFSHTYVLTN